MRIAGALFVLGAMACAPDDRAAPPRFFGAGATTPTRGGELRISLTDDVRALDPAISFDEYSTLVTHHIFDTLLDYAPATAADPIQLEPELAESWSISPDGRTYSFILRPGLVYADGEPIVAGDFVYALERILDPKTGSGAAQFYTSIEGAQEFIDGKAPHVTGLHAQDDTHLEIHLDKPDSIFPMLVALNLSTPMKQSWVERVKDHLVDTPLASGPYLVDSWNRGTRIVLKKNPRYWNADSIYIDQITINLLVPRDVAVLKFQSGEVDTMDRLGSDDFIRFAQTPAWQPYMIRKAQVGVYGEVMNVRMKPFDDKRVRQAMNYAFNKFDTVVLYNGRAAVAHGIIPPTMAVYDPDIPAYLYDPPLARMLLAEAGYPHGFTVTYSTTNDEFSLRMAQSLQADLANVGVTMNIQILTFPAYLTEAGKGQLQFAYSGWAADFPDPWDFLWSRFDSESITPENANNDSGYSNPEFDKLVEGARFEVDPHKRLEMYRQAERIVHDDCPWIWHYYPFQVEVTQPYVKGYQPHPIWLRDFRHTWLDLPRVSR